MVILFVISKRRVPHSRRHVWGIPCRVAIFGDRYRLAGTDRAPRPGNHDISKPDERQAKKKVRRTGMFIGIRMSNKINELSVCRESYSISTLSIVASVTSGRPTPRPEYSPANLTMADSNYQPRLAGAPLPGKAR